MNATKIVHSVIHQLDNAEILLVCVADSELVLKFSAGLAVSVNLVATVDNVPHIDRLRVQVHITLFRGCFNTAVFISARISSPSVDNGPRA